jgi:hypothetical protein
MPNFINGERLLREKDSVQNFARGNASQKTKSQKESAVQINPHHENEGVNIKKHFLPVYLRQKKNISHPGKNQRRKQFGFVKTAGGGTGHTDGRNNG